MRPFFGNKELDGPTCLWCNEFLEMLLDTGQFHHHVDPDKGDLRPFGSIFSLFLAREASDWILNQPAYQEWDLKTCFEKLKQRFKHGEKVAFLQSSLGGGRVQVRESSTTWKTRRHPLGGGGAFVLLPVIEAHSEPSKATSLKERDSGAYSDGNGDGGGTLDVNDSCQAELVAGKRTHGGDLKVKQAQDSEDNEGKDSNISGTNPGGRKNRSKKRRIGTASQPSAEVMATEPS